MKFLMDKNLYLTLFSIKKRDIIFILQFLNSVLAIFFSFVILISSFIHYFEKVCEKMVFLLFPQWGG